MKRAACRLQAWARPLASLLVLGVAALLADAAPWAAAPAMVVPLAALV